MTAAHYIQIALLGLGYLWLGRAVWQTVKELRGIPAGHMWGREDK